MSPITWYKTGLVTLIVFGLAHLGGFIQSARAARAAPALAEVTAAMRAVRTRLLGMEASLLDFREYFSVSFSLFLLLVAALGFAEIRGAADPIAVVRRLSPIIALAMAVLAGLSVRYGVPQGAIVATLAALAFAKAAWVGRT